MNETQKVIKNMMAFNVSFMLMYSAINALISVQSVLNQDAGLGIKSLSLIYTTQIICCLVFPQLIVELIGFKWSLVFCQLLSAVYVTANAIPMLYTLLPGSCFVIILLPNDLY